MGRPKREGFRLRKRKGRPYEVLFTLDDGTDYDLGLGTHDRETARVEAQQRYLAALRGELEPKRKRATDKQPTAATLQTFEAGAEWLAQSVGRLREKTRNTYEVYLHLLDSAMPSVADWSEDGFDALLSARLAVVQAQTARKEFAVFRALVEFAFARHWLPRLIAVPSVPKRAKGTRFDARRRCAADEYSPAEIEALIVALPEWSRRSRKDGVSRYPIRARFLVSYDLALRPEVANVAEIGVTWSPGRFDWWIPAEHDKIGNARMLPLPARCVAALESLGLTSGLIFGAHDYRESIHKAALTVLPKHKADRLCAQHLRSAGGSHLLELTGDNLLGVQFIMGHKQVSTTARYMRTSARAGAEAMAAAEAKRTA